MDKEPLLLFEDECKAEGGSYVAVFHKPDTKRITIVRVGGRNLTDRFDAPVVAAIQSQLLNTAEVPWFNETVFIHGQPFEYSMGVNFTRARREVQDNDIERLKGYRIMDVARTCVEEYGCFFSLKSKLRLYLPTHFTALHELLREHHV
jgi:hypothetical protein